MEHCSRVENQDFIHTKLKLMNAMGNSKERAKILMGRITWKDRGMRLIWSGINKGIACNSNRMANHTLHTFYSFRSLLNLRWLQNCVVRVDVSEIQGISFCSISGTAKAAGIMATSWQYFQLVEIFSSAEQSSRLVTNLIQTEKTFGVKFNRIFEVECSLYFSSLLRLDTQSNASVALLHIRWVNIIEEALMRHKSMGVRYRTSWMDCGSRNQETRPKEKDHKIIYCLYLLDKNENIVRKKFVLLSTPMIIK